MYLTFDEYTNYIKYHTVGADEFDNFLVYAEAVIDSYTFSVIGKKNLMDVPVVAEKIKKATAFQIEFMSRDGVSGYMDDSGKKVVSRSVNIGGTSESVTYSTESVEAMTGTGMKVSPMAAALLAPIKAMGRMVG